MSGRAELLARAVAVGAVAAVASGCYVFHFGNPDSTLVQQMPADVPPQQWLDGDPRVAVIFDGVFRSFGEGPALPDENASFTYARRLRKAKLFAEVGGPDFASAPELPGRVRIELHYEEDLNDATNLAKAAIAPGLTGYRLDLRGTATLHLELPDGETRSYQATTALTRLYYRSQRRDLSRRILHQQVDDTNFLALVHQLRAEPLLFGHPSADPLPPPQP